VAKGVHTGKEIHLDVANHDYDVYVILFKDGKVSAPLVIKTGSGGIIVDSEWEDEAPEGFVAVQGGTFQMGSTTGQSDEQPVHEVTVSNFYMSKYEVTQAEWEAVMGSENNPSITKGDNLPVDSVYWLDVVEYCNALSAKEDLTPAYTIIGTTVTLNSGTNGYRLPTEAEWEYAARGGVNHNTYKYSGSDMLGEVAWYDGNSDGKTHPVGKKKANSLGLHDMTGNVPEWCWDWYDNYSAGDQTDPTGASSGTYRVVRGGSWSDKAPGYLPCTCRNVNEYDATYLDLGFRLVRP
jgi:formylglycine-generating enzyme required for sulfatase activity